jgi:uncharacterized protein (TIGR00299 family) protein
VIGYLDLVSGLSGDILLGCLVDAGWPVEQLRDTIARLGLAEGEWGVEARRVMRGPFNATLVDVRAAEGRTHRHLSHILGIIDAADIGPSTKQRAAAVFERLAAAEAKVHGTTVERVHFHEVGAVDAIVDVVGAAAGLEALGITRLHASAVPLGDGWADTQHGRIPLPAPATLEILAGAGAPTRPALGPGEWVTPTGAAILAALATFGQPSLRLERIGIGAGQREAAWPNVARLWIGSEIGGGTLVQLETNIDDMNPQLFAAVAEGAFAAGALDVWFTPVQMKKGRPGVVLSALVPRERQHDVAGVILRESTTLGVRAFALEGRDEARREVREVPTPFGPIRVKVKWVGADAVGAGPEYDDCARAAARCGVPVKSVHEAATAAAHQLVLSLRG